MVLCVKFSMKSDKGILRDYKKRQIYLQTCLLNGTMQYILYDVEIC